MATLRTAAVKIFPSLSLAALSVAASIASASASDRPVTQGDITTSTSATMAPRAALQASTPEVAPVRKVRVVLASPYRTTN